MKFLRESTDDGKEEPEAIKISKTYEPVIQCDNCDYWGKMKGGPLVTDRKQAVFQCPECEAMKWITWNFQ